MFRIDILNKNETKTLHVYGDKSILTELENHHVFLDYSCRQGHCGSCLVKLISGQVLHEESLVQPTDGQILTCCAKPVSDITIQSID
jgi:ferredoxin